MKVFVIERFCASKAIYWTGMGTIQGTLFGPDQTFSYDVFHAVRFAHAGSAAVVMQKVLNDNGRVLEVEIGEEPRAEAPAAAASVVEGLAFLAAPTPPSFDLNDGMEFG